VKKSVRIETDLADRNFQEAFLIVSLFGRFLLIPVLKNQQPSTNAKLVLKKASFEVVTNFQQDDSL